MIGAALQVVVEERVRPCGCVGCFAVLRSSEWRSRRARPISANRSCADRARSSAAPGGAALGRLLFRRRMSARAYSGADFSQRHPDAGRPSCCESAIDRASACRDWTLLGKADTVGLELSAASSATTRNGTAPSSASRRTTTAPTSRWPATDCDRPAASRRRCARHRTSVDRHRVGAHHRLRHAARARRLGGRQLHALRDSSASRSGARTSIAHASRVDLRDPADDAPVTVFHRTRRRSSQDSATVRLWLHGRPRRRHLPDGSNLFVRAEYEYVQFGDFNEHQGAHPYRARRRRPEVLDHQRSEYGGAGPTRAVSFASAPSRIFLDGAFPLPYFRRRDTSPQREASIWKDRSWRSRCPPCGRPFRTSRPAPAPSAPAGPSKPSKTHFSAARTAPRAARRSSSAPSSRRARCSKSRRTSSSASCRPPIPARSRWRCGRCWARARSP